MFPEIETECDGNNFLSFWVIFPFTWRLTTKIKLWKKCKKRMEILSFYTCVHKWRSYDVWFLRCKAQWTEFLSCWVIFYPFTPLTTQKIRILKNEIKKKHGDIILHKCTINGNHMIYDSWDMKSSRWDFFVILGHFLPYNPSNNAKNQYLLKWKKCLEISSFYTSPSKIMIICYTGPEIWLVMDEFFFILGYCLSFYLPNSPKKCMEISSFYSCVPKIMVR